MTSFVKANVRNRQEEVLLRTYDGDDPQLISEKISVIDAIKFTLVAFGGPGISSPLSYQPDEPDQSHKDNERHDKSIYGGPSGLQSSPLPRDSDWNNPIYDVYREARTIWPDRYIKIVSIGYDMESSNSSIESERLVSHFKTDYPETSGLGLFRFQPLGFHFGVGIPYKRRIFYAP